MRILHLTTMIFCHILLSSFILYFTLTSASPLAEQSAPKTVAVVEPPKNVAAPVAKPQEHPMQYAAMAKVEPATAAATTTQYKAEKPQKIETGSGFVQQKDSSLMQKSSSKPIAPKVESPMVEPAAAEVKPYQQPPKYMDQQQISPKVNTEESPVVVASAKQEQPALPVQQSPVAPEIVKAVEPKPVELAAPVKVYESPAKPVVKQVETAATVPSLHDSVQEKLIAAQPEPVVVAPGNKVQQDPVVVPEISKQASPASVQAAPVAGVAAAASGEPAKPVVVSSPPVVKGGLGPLHLLAATLCSYQPHKPVSDETLTYLYNQRAAQRKSLFQFMSLKFTNLDKLTSHLNAGLEVAKTAVDSSESSLVRSHGWPVVGNCTSHYLKLMAEAAWCDCAEEPHCLRDLQEARSQQQPPVVASQPRLLRRSAAFDAEPASSSVMSKLMYVGDIKEAPIVESAQKVAASPAQPASVASTRQCRRNALRLAKALFNHLAENQTEVSESWPKLHQELAQDECARKRMIDIVTALSTFRSESTQVHRDNIEFAFAMDDLRGKVLENEVNTPLTFDKQVIEVEQFLQQSVRLMLANIDPKRAKLTSMRYRSLHAPVSADDQCIELHQRLLAKNYPDECNPNQYGPLPDVLRMAALSLDLWSIEQDLAKYSSPAAAPKQQDVNECFANLVAN